MFEVHGDNYDETKGIVFGFEENTIKRDKYIKDVIYFKQWGEPRNRVLETLAIDEWDEYQNIGTNLFKNIKLTDDHFTILLLDIPEYKTLSAFHEQSSDMSCYWLDMDTRYEHKDKPLRTMIHDIDHVKIIGNAKSNVTKNNKLDITVNI